MRVLCAIGMRDGPEMITQIQHILGGSLDLLILHVIDTEARLGLQKALGGPGMLRPGERPRQGLSPRLRGVQRRDSQQQDQRGPRAPGGAQHHVSSGHLPRHAVHSRHPKSAPLA